MIGWMGGKKDVRRVLDGRSKWAMTCLATTKSPVFRQQGKLWARQGQDDGQHDKED